MSSSLSSKHSYRAIPRAEYDGDIENGSYRNQFGNQVYLDKQLREQDSNLDMLDASVSRLGEMSLNISKEIDLQNRMLTSLEIDTDDAHEKASNLTKRTSELVAKSGGPKYFCIILTLVFILIFLFLLVIYT